MILITWHPGKGKTMETVKILVLARGSGEGKETTGGGWTRDIFRAVKLFCTL